MRHCDHLRLRFESNSTGNQAQRRRDSNGVASQQRHSCHGLLGWLCVCLGRSHRPQLIQTVRAHRYLAGHGHFRARQNAVHRVCERRQDLPAISSASVNLFATNTTKRIWAWCQTTQSTIRCIPTLYMSRRWYLLTYLPFFCSCATSFTISWMYNCIPSTQPNLLEAH